MVLPLCSSFVPTILEGQRCYKLELKELSGKGRRNELMLLLDYNEERSLQTSFEAKEDMSRFSLQFMNLDTAVKGLQGVSAKVQINTLSPSVHYGGGLFSMTEVKKMTTKKDFFKLPLNERGCVGGDLYEDCRTASLVKECNCVPWELPGYQVGSTHK